VEVYAATREEAEEERRHKATEWIVKGSSDEGVFFLTGMRVYFDTSWGVLVKKNKTHGAKER
jgi:hypothetical protein